VYYQRPGPNYENPAGQRLQVLCSVPSHYFSTKNVVVCDRRKLCK